MTRLPLLSDPPTADPPPTAGPLLDTFGRGHTNLRVSVTDRCNLRCTYCMPEDVVFRDRRELLTFEEIAAVVRVAVGLGITKVRLTGGEPLLRRNLPELVRQLAGLPELRDLGLTTNGILLAEQAAALRAAGLRRLNVSLDTLDPDRFRRLARRDGLDRVLAGLAAARAAGFESIKVNAVALRGVTDADVLPLARFCRAEGYELRFIESMPIGADPWDREQLLPADELLATLSTLAPLTPVKDQDPHAPAAEYEYADGGRVGVIASVTRSFCGQCDRLRLTADGKLRNCLFALTETDLRPLVRRPLPDAAGLESAFRASVWGKWAGHHINAAGFVKPSRTMHAIGG